jgi:hypothetical protein
MGISGVPLKKTDIIQAIYLAKGIIVDAAVEIGCSMDAIYDWMKRDEEVAFAVKDARNKRDEERKDQDRVLIDEAYKSALALLKTHDANFTKFTLTAKANWSQEATNHNITIQRIDKPYHEHTDSS